MTGEEVKKMTSEEIGVELQRLRDRLYSLRTQTVTEKVEDHSLFTKLRRDIARLLTERSTRRHAAAPARPTAKPAPAKVPAGRTPARKPRVAKPASAKPAPRKSSAKKAAKK